MRRDMQLFLYGSLLTATADHDLNRRMRRLLRRARPATIRARLYDLGGYPGAIVSRDETERVYGKLVTIQDPYLLRRLDRYEDHRRHDPGRGEFQRTTIRAHRLGSGKSILCWVSQDPVEIHLDSPLPEPPSRRKTA